MRPSHRLLRLSISIIIIILFGVSCWKFLGNSQQSGLPIVNAQVVQSADPCATTSIAKIGIPINIASATTVSLVAPGTTANSIINICGMSLTLSGTTAPTFTLEYGTGATCGTGTTAMTGAYLGGAASAPTAIFTGTGALVVAAAAANRVCAVTGGTAPNAQGVLTYVVQPQ